MRLNKFVAHCGICSRRKAAELVKSGQVKVNGQIEPNPAYVVLDEDQVEYEGKIISPEKEQVYLLMNKPKHVLSTVTDDRGRKTVMDIIHPKPKERIYPVGRLDRDTTGLLLLTNDGDLATKLAHPRYEVLKKYHVKLNDDFKDEYLQKIREGIVLEDGSVEVDQINFVKGASKAELIVCIHIGRNRIVRRIFEHFNYQVIYLDRIYYAGLTKKDIPRGKTRKLTEKEIIMLKHFS